MKNSFCILLLALGMSVNAQVAINSDNSNPDPSAMLDVKSTDKGMLVPRMTTTQRTAISMPASGLLVFDSTTGSFWFYNSGAWQELTGGGSEPWIPSGNNISYSAGNVGIGDNTPNSSLTVGNGEKFQVSGTLPNV